MIVIQKFKPSPSVILQKFGAVEGFEALAQEAEARALAWVIGPPGSASPEMLEAIVEEAVERERNDPLLLVESLLNTGL